MILLEASCLKTMKVNQVSYTVEMGKLGMSFVSLRKRNGTMTRWVERKANSFGRNGSLALTGRHGATILERHEPGLHYTNSDPLLLPASTLIARCFTFGTLVSD